MRRPRPARVAAAAAVCLAAGAAFASWLSLRASADLALGRERLLAGDARSARAAFARAGWWPGTRAAAHAGRIATGAREGHPAAEAVDPALLEGFAPEALVGAALEQGRLDAGAALADLERRAGLPLGDLHAAAVALENGDESTARSTAAASTVPLESRGLGRRLRRALDALAARHSLLLDRDGELLATIGADGGLEATADAAPVLAATVGRLPALREGRAARSSLDLSLSRAALAALAGHRGSIVLVAPASGDVLAAVTDARTAVLEADAAFTQQREPASIAKILTAAAAYRAGIDADAAIGRMTCTGVERYGGQPLWCAWPAGPLEGLDHALSVSCNLAFANLAVVLGTERLEQEYRRWGFDGAGGALLDGSGRIRERPRTPLELAHLAIGLDLAELTPLHAALLAATVANGGRLEEPIVLAGACGPLGFVETPLPRAPAREVLEPAVARRLARAMRAVAERGTGSGLAPERFPVAMKTGTGAEPGLGYHVNYIGFGPLPDADVAFCVRVTHGSSSPAVTRAAREVTRRLLAALGDRRDRLARRSARAPAR